MAQTSDGTILKSVDQVHVGDPIAVKVFDGVIKASVTEELRNESEESDI